jgi:hypothetical protein
MINPVIDKLGNQRWYNDTGYHRTDGPAAIYFDGSESWWINGKLHRTDGPAILSSDVNDDWKEWYINNKRCHDNKSFQEAAGISDEDMTAIILKYGNVK